MQPETAGQPESPGQSDSSSQELQNGEGQGDDADGFADGDAGSQPDIDDLGLHDLSWEELRDKFHQEMAKQTTIESDLKDEFRKLTSVRALCIEGYRACDGD